MKPTTLAKSRFVTGVDCPQKLIYGQDRSFRNLSREDSFLASLADGGFQAGQFAKALFPGGHDIVALDIEESISQTSELLDKGDCVIFEAAIRYENCFVRVDVLEKKANRLVIHEVKAKSYRSREKTPFLTKKGSLNSSWRRYLYDVAFQKYVLSKAFPNASVTANLMLVDKDATCPADGLHQCFKVINDNGRRSAQQVSDIPEGVLQAGLLKSVPVDYECDLIFQSRQHGAHFIGDFEDLVQRLSDVCEMKATPVFSLYSGCGKCEFKRIGREDELLSGFDTCISSKTGIRNIERGNLIFDLWDNRGKSKQLRSGAIKLTDLSEDDLKSPHPRVSGIPLSRNQRQWLQIEKVRDGDSTPYIDAVGLQEEMNSWEFPLHFIDFETMRAALPFFEGHSPYHNIAFQFSHHRVTSDGAVIHANQFLLADATKNPNTQFVRALKDAIGGDGGTIFMYSSHEKSTLNAIHDDLELEADDESKELRAFIESIAAPKRDAVKTWQPVRPMVDLLKIVKQYVYLPATSGSNSLKAVLPAVLNASSFLKRVYSQPVYGKDCDVSSLNIEATAWVREDATGKVINPYSQLPKLGIDLSDDEKDELEGLDQIKDGGAALTAYARLMYEDLSNEARASIEQSLLEYCELDTLAMVFLYQGLKDLMSTSRI